MSKKTENINESLNKLESYVKQLSNYWEGPGDLRTIEDLSFGAAQELKNLRFWINSLYQYNGKSTSTAKKNASRANGAKGGRPPKEITELKKRLNLLENEVIPEKQKAKLMTDDYYEEKKLTEEIEQLTSEIIEIKNKISEYKR